MLGAIFLLLCPPAGAAFWVIYGLCGVSDVSFPHTTANKLTGLLLFLTAPTLFWSIVPMVFVAAVATFAAVQEGHFIRTRKA